MIRIRKSSSRTFRVVEGLFALTPFFCHPLSSQATTGLSSLEGLGYFYLLVIVLFIAAIALVGYLLRYAYRLYGSKDRTRRKKGIAIYALIAFASLAAVNPFVDFNFYVLVDNEYENAITITKSHLGFYFEVEDGRAFYLKNENLNYFKPGRAIVIQEDKQQKDSLRAYDTFEASGGRMFFEQRKREEGKLFWVPMIPSKRNRIQLVDRGPVLALSSNWKFSEISSRAKRVPWCCDPEWVKLLLKHGAQPNSVVNDRIPLYEALAPSGWIKDKKELGEIELVLEELLSVDLDINLTNSFGNTALHNAAGAGNEEPILWLLRHGANPDLRNNNGATPLDILRNNRNDHGEYWTQELLDKNQKMINLLERVYVHAE